MTITTNYGSWTTTVDNYSLTVEQTVAECLGDYANDYDVAAIVAEYRAAIDAVLPAGVSLLGSEFYGPAYAADCHFAGYPTNSDGALDIKALVDGVEFWDIATRHDLTI